MREFPQSSLKAPCVGWCLAKAVTSLESPSRSGDRALIGVGGPGDLGEFVSQGAGV